MKYYRTKQQRVAKEADTLLGQSIMIGKKNMYSVIASSSVGADTNGGEAK